MPFNRDEACKLLAACHRRCCICHRFSGIKMELDHIIPSAEGGSDHSENAIPVCFECHAEIHLYNDQHPRGHKFRPAELRLHKEQWLKICNENPLHIVDTVPVKTVGPLHSLIDELEFNDSVSTRKDVGEIGCPFEVSQFDRAIDAGLISLLEPKVRDSLYDCYLHLKRANERLKQVVFAENPGRRADALNEAQHDVIKASIWVREARAQLLQFLSSESESADPAFRTRRDGH